MTAVIRCKYDELVPIKELKKKVNPNNTNKHPKEQVERLAKIMNYQGIRKPIYISRQSGLIQAGHGRLLSAIKMGLNEFPVEYQEYDNEEQALADVTSDNAIATWAELDMSMVNEQLAEMGKDFDVEYLGLENLKNILEVPAPNFNSNGQGEIEQITFILHYKQAELIRKAIGYAKEINEHQYGSEQNTNQNGNALTFICEKFVQNGKS